VKQAADIILNTRGVEHVAPFAGLDATTSTVASYCRDDFLRLPLSLQTRNPLESRQHGYWRTSVHAFP